MKHTRGPWKIEVDTQELFNVQKNESFAVPVYRIAAETSPVAKIEMSHEANAQLIAAAPELLEALEALEEQFLAEESDGHNRKAVLLKIAVAIAKARGES